MTVDVILATYNGEAYLGEFLQSLGRQTYTEWNLLARDDGSTDATVALLDAFADRYPGKVRVFRRPDDAPRGVVLNFSAAAGESDAPYLCFADQDDVWLPEKISTLVTAMQECEARYGNALPILVHSDLRVVDEALAPVADSFMAYQGLSPTGGARLARLLVRNVVTGCAMMINRSLRHKAMPLPNEAVMHDWWYALVAASMGKLTYVPEPLVAYRQHGANTLGAQRLGLSLIVARLRFFERSRQRLRAKVLQAGCLLKRYRDSMTEEDLHLLEGFSKLYERHPLARRWDVVRFGFWDSGLIRNLGFLAAL